MKLDSKRLVCLMIDRKLTNKELSVLSGVSKSRISLVRNGASCSYSTAEKLASVFSVPTYSLIEKSDDVNHIEILIDKLNKSGDLSDADKELIAMQLRNDC